MTKARGYISKTGRFVRSFTEGLEGEGFRRLFDEEAAEAYRVLSRDRPQREEPKDGLMLWLYRARVMFLGVSEKLSPPKRALFGISVLATLLGVFWPTEIDFSVSDTYFALDFSPLWFLTAIGGFAYLLIFELVDRIRVRDELEVARQLQSEILPQESPVLVGYAFAHSYRTANAVGGDYYDFLPLGDGRMVLAVGDASGHGISAGLLMAIANATLMTAIDIDPAPERVVELLNRSLYRTGDRRAFMTLFYGILEPDSGRFQYVCAGHPFPLIRRANGSIEEIGRGSLPLGMRPQIELRTESVLIEPGDTLLLYTDGLAETVAEGSERAFGFTTIRDLMREPAQAYALHDRVLTAFERHQGAQPLADDMTLVVVTRHPLPKTQPPQPPGAQQTNSEPAEKSEPFDDRIAGTR